MKKNIGKTDKIIRIALALIIAISYFVNLISGTTAIILGGFSLILILTSFINFCPIYAIFKINTNKEKNDK